MDGTHPDASPAQAKTTPGLRVFYNSLGTPEMYDLIRAKAGEGVELVTLDTDDDAERTARIAGCDVAINSEYSVVSSPRSVLGHHGITRCVLHSSPM